MVALHVTDLLAGHKVPKTKTTVLGCRQNYICDLVSLDFGDVFFVRALHGEKWQYVDQSPCRPLIVDVRCH
jgi:hypothetical protein